MWSGMQRKHLQIIILMVGITVAHSTFALKEPRDSKDDSNWNGQFFQSDAACALKPDPQYQKLPLINRREDLVRASRTINLLGNLIPNPICMLANRTQSENQIQNFVAAARGNCTQSRERPDCRLAGWINSYRELISTINLGSEKTDLEVPKEWHTIDMRAGNFTRPVTFKDLKTGDDSLGLAAKLIGAEIGIHDSLKEMVGWLKSTRSNSGAVESIAGIAISGLYRPFIGSATLSLFEIWTCTPSAKNHPRLDSCGVRRDVLYLLLRDAINDLGIEAVKITQNIERAHASLRTGAQPTDFKFAPQNSTSNTHMDRLKNVIEVTNLIREVKAEFAQTKSLQATKSFSKLSAKIIEPAMRGLVGEMSSGQGADEFLAYRSMTEITEFITLLTLLRDYKLNDPEVSPNQYALWANTWAVEQTKRELRNYFHEQMNIINALVEEGAKP